ncbi:hypothetical protein D0C16_06870 [Cellvibrio sp. KY-GH-1]|nr:hypothetical protein D0C16_06870 [Cellvibrio sp. KY-GH-1]
MKAIKFGGYVGDFIGGKTRVRIILPERARFPPALVPKVLNIVAFCWNGKRILRNVKGKNAHGS